MVQLTDEDQERMKELGVAALYLFGSRAQEIAGPLSDYDFAVLMRDPSIVHPSKGTMDLYLKLYALLDPYCSRTLENDVIDIVFLQSGVSLELQANVVRHGIPLVDNDPDLRARYEEQVMRRMADFRPLLNLMDQAILASL